MSLHTGNTVFDLTDTVFKLQTSASETNKLPLDQPAS